MDGGRQRRPSLVLAPQARALGEAGLIDEDHCRYGVHYPLSCARPVVSESLLNGRLITLFGLTGGALAAPAHSVQDLEDMAGMILHVEQLGSQLRDPFQFGPSVSDPVAARPGDCSDTAPLTESPDRIFLE